MHLVLTGAYLEIIFTLKPAQDAVEVKNLVWLCVLHNPAPPPNVSRGGAPVIQIIYVCSWLAMGVHGLTSFVNNSFTFWERRKVQGKLVVDGSSLCHNLYRADWTHGGQYPEYRRTTLEYFHALQRADISPIIVFDGIDYKQEKTKVTIRRRNEWIKRIHSVLSSPTRKPDRGLILPMLAIEVFQQTLRELKVPLYVVDGEADAMVVQIANHYSCPVLSSYSDFFIFNVEGGYISMDNFNWNTTPVTADVFNVRAFTEQFRFENADLLLMIPAILGNDFINPADSSFMRYIGDNAGQGTSKTMAVVRYASRFRSLQNFVDQIDSIPPEVVKTHLKKNCERAKEMYLLQSTVDPDELELSTDLRQLNGTSIPDSVFQQYRLAKLPLSIMEAVVLGKCILRIVVDNSQLQSSVIVSRPLRQYMYHILKLSSVAEVFRHGLSLEQETVCAINTADVLKLPDAVNIPKLNLPERKHIFFTALGCGEEVFEQIDESWQLVASSLVYWARNAGVPIHLVKSLISCILLCSTCADKPPGLPEEPVEFKRSPKWMAALHSFAQWQCVYFDAITLSQLLMEPVKVVSPARLYDGKIALCLASARNVDRTVSRLPIDRTLYDVLLGSVLSHQKYHIVGTPSESVEQKTIQEQAGSSSGKQRKKENKRVPQKKFDSRFAHHNRFALLEHTPSDSSEDS